MRYIGQPKSMRSGRRPQSMVVTPVEAVMAGIFPVDSARFDDKAHFASSTGPVTSIPGGYALGNSAVPVFKLPSTLTGAYWVSTLLSGAGVNIGSYRPGTLPTVYNPEALRSRGGRQIWDFPSIAAATQIRIIGAASLAADLQQMQLVDMAATLAQPADVWIAFWQSNMAMTTQGVAIDMADDDWTDKRLLMFPGAANTAHGSVLGKITGLRAPMQMQSNTAEALTAGMISFGVSPAIAFAKGILPKVAAGRNLVIICAAVSGTGIEGAAAPWKPDSSNPFAYNHMMSLVAQAMAALPAGSVIKGMIGAGGEADTSADMSTHSAAVELMLSTASAAWITAGYCASRPPCVLVGPPPDASRANQAVLVACHAALDKFSGHATSLANVHVAATGPWGMEDSTHRTASAARFAGAAAAKLAIARNLV